MLTRTTIALASETGLVTVNGKDYLLGRSLVVSHTYPDRTPAVFIDYWSTRNGKKFGPIRGANSTAKPSSVGGVLIAASLAPASAAAPLARFDWPRVHGAVR